jgi:hypothetical protein
VLIAATIAVVVTRIVVIFEPNRKADQRLFNKAPRNTPKHRALLIKYQEQHMLMERSERPAMIAAVTGLMQK